MRTLPSHLVTVFVTFKSHWEWDCQRKTTNSHFLLVSCFGRESLFPGNHFWWKKGSRTAPISHVVAPEFILSFSWRVKNLFVSRTGSWKSVLLVISFAIGMAYEARRLARTSGTREWDTASMACFSLYGKPISPSVPEGRSKHSMAWVRMHFRLTCVIQRQ